MKHSPEKPGHNEWNQAAEAAQRAVAHAGQAGSHVASAIGELAGQACGELGQKADEITASAGTRLKEMGKALGSDESPGVMGTVSNALADSIVESGEYLESTKASGLVQDVATVVRRNPIPSVVVALCCGWFLGRATRK